MSELTTVVEAPSPEPPAPIQVEPRRKGHLIRAELLKIFTTRTWWIFGLCIMASAALSIVVNLFQAQGDLANAVYYSEHPPDFTNLPAEQRPTPEQMAAIEATHRQYGDVSRVLANAAASVYTSGQLLNLMFVVILGSLIVTNEYLHQTATSTYLTTPQRTRVIVAKFVAAVMLATGFWAATTALSIGVGALNFNYNGWGVPFADWAIGRSILMNLLAYVLWAIVGVGLGVLIQGQLGATVTGAALYWISWPVAGVLFGIIHDYVIRQDWVLSAAVALPGVASYVMVAPERVQLNFTTALPPWWVGAAVLLTYGVVAGIVGTLLTRRRDIS